MPDSKSPEVGDSRLAIARLDYGVELTGPFHVDNPQEQRHLEELAKRYTKRSDGGIEYGVVRITVLTHEKEEQENA